MSRCASPDDYHKAKLLVKYTTRAREVSLERDAGGWRPEGEGG